MSGGTPILLKKTNSFSSIDFLAQGRPPPVIVEIPLHRLGESAGKGFFSPPAKFSLQLAGINRISMIVSRTIRHIGDVLTVRSAAGPELIKSSTDVLDYLQVCPLVSSTDIVGLTRHPSLQNQIERFSVILDIEPITNIGPVSVNRQGL